jgi:hypothetical protein
MKKLHKVPTWQVWIMLARTAGNLLGWILKKDMMQVVAGIWVHTKDVMPSRRVWAIVHELRHGLIWNYKIIMVI